MNRFVAALVALALWPGILQAQGSDDVVVSTAARVLVSTAAIPYEAGILVYDEKSGIVELKDNFEVERDSQVLTGEYLRYDLNSGVVQAQGHLHYDDPKIILRGDRLEAVVSSETLHWQGNVRGYFRQAPWRFTAKEIDATDKEYVGKGVKFTSCDRPDPDYYIWSRRAVMNPGQKASFEHAVFYFGPVPFWYWPRYSKNLGEKPLYTVYFNPGQSGHEGTYARNIVAIPLSGDKLYLRAHVDIFTKLGLGIGPEILYKSSESRRASLYMYTVRESNGTRQWDIRADGYYEQNQEVSYQGTFRFQQDPNFNNLFFKDNPERVVPELNSSFALNWRRGNYQTRAYYSDTWKFDDSEDDKFKSVNQSLPGLEGILHPTGIWKNRLFLQSNVSLIHLRTRELANSHSFDRWTTAASAKAYRPWRMPLTSFVTGTYGATLSHSYQTNTSLTDNASLGQSRYGGELVTRVAPINALDLTMTYTYTLRSEVNSLRQETSAADKGLDVNRLELMEIGRLPFGANLYMRTFYNFPRVPEAYPISWTQGLEPVFGSLSFLIPRGPSMVLSTSYEVYNHKYLHTVNLTQVYSKVLLSGNVQYDNNNPNTMLPSVTAAIKNVKGFESINFTYRGELAHHWSPELPKYSHNILEREVTLVPALHDFLLSVTFRARREVHEFFFTIRLRMEDQTEEKLLRQLGEDEYYPWRRDPTKS